MPINSPSSEIPDLLVQTLKKIRLCAGRTRSSGPDTSAAAPSSNRRLPRGRAPTSPPPGPGGPWPAPEAHAAACLHRLARAARVRRRLRRRPPPPAAASPRRPASPRLGSGRAPPSSSSSSHAGLLPRQVRRAATVTPACIGKRADLNPDLRNSSRLTFRP